MKKLDIAITKAQLQSFTLDIRGNEPQVTATIGLFTEGGKKITEYSASTNAWDETKKLTIPPEALYALGTAAKIIEASIVKHCRDSQGALTAGDDAPINLDEIPF